MNQRNVEAIEALHSAWERAMGADEVDEVPSLGEFLAAHGVLVPSALTDEDCRDLPAYYPETSTVDPERVWADLRAVLERIAKGEA